MPNSLAARLFLSAALWIVAVLVIAGLLLSSLLREAFERNLDARLNVYAETLVARGLEPGAERLSEPGPIGEPLFERPLSGWYWQIVPIERPTEAISSPSLFGRTLSLSPEDGDGEAFDLRTPDGEALRVVSRVIEVGVPPHAYRVSVAAPLVLVRDEAGLVTRMLMATLAAFGVALLLTILFQVRFGLRPLERLRDELARVRRGDTRRLAGTYPKEIAPLVGEMNGLLESNAQVVERARTQVGNLAHALKTPLSVITNEARDLKGAAATLVEEQAVMMRRQVDYYLDRARAAARLRVIGAVVPVAPTIAGLVRALKGIHRDRGIRFEIDCPDDLGFRGEKQDLEEIAGNLLDNAFKWARGEVRAAVAPGAPLANGFASFTLTIDDDGPGLPEDKREEAMARGSRLDEAMPGSGLGLSIVAELVSLYEGRIVLEKSPLGGLRAVIRLPAA